VMGLPFFVVVWLCQSHVRTDFSVDRAHKRLIHCV
jgi:hypothetical protein